VTTTLAQRRLRHSVYSSFCNGASINSRYTCQIFFSQYFLNAFCRNLLILLNKLLQNGYTMRQIYKKRVVHVIALNSCEILNATFDKFQKATLTILKLRQPTSPPPLTGPLWTRSIKFEPLRKKYQSTQIHPPEIKKFLPYPSEKTQRSKDADAHNPSETAFLTPLRNSRPCVH
jgi:hypothetical protein